MDQVQIFISYAREDQERVKQFYHRLVQAGFHPWLDREHILPGMKWEPIIKAALKRSDFALVCLSATSINKRGFLQKEIKEALEHAKEKLDDDIWLITARLDECDVPESLSAIQWVDLFEDDGWEQLLAALAYQLKKDGKQMPSPQKKAETPRPDPQKPSQEARKEKGEPKSQPATSPSARQEKPAITPSESRPNFQAFDFTTVRLNALGEEIERGKGQAQQFIEDLGGGVKLEMVYVPGGKFVMGSDESDREKPLHDVTVPSFFFGKYQITQEQWQAVAGAKELKVKHDLKPDPSSFKGDDRLPVECVSWDDSVEFCARLAKKTGIAYRLPTEAEWEYACRAGTITPFAFGPTITPNIVNYHGEHPYGNAPKGVYRGKTVPVGSLGVANSFGLYDMHGNVWEWCQDAWHDSYKDAPTDGSAWLSGGDSSPRMLRGGAYSIDARSCRSAYRFSNVARNFFIYNVGLRVVVAART